MDGMRRDGDEWKVLDFRPDEPTPSTLSPVSDFCMGTYSYDSEGTYGFVLPTRLPTRGMKSTTSIPRRAA